MNKLEKLQKIAVISEDGNVKLPCWAVTFIIPKEYEEYWDPYDDEEDEDVHRFYGDDEETKQEAYKCFQNPPEGNVEGLQRIEFVHEEFEAKWVNGKRSVQGSPEWKQWFENLQNWI